jgi:hypothetical protein
LLSFLAAGCWSGHLFEMGRVRESVVAYHGAFSDGERLLLDYSVELADWRGRPLRHERRAAAVPVAALSAAPELPVDAFPLERVRLSEARSSEDRRLPLVAADTADAPAGAPYVALLDGDGRHGFMLCAAHDRCQAVFHSEALYRDRTAWWVYPILPFSVALDLALLPGQVIGVAPFFLLGE